METKTPRGRQKHVTSGTQTVHKRGDGLGTGPVGSGHGPGGSPSGNRGPSGGNQSPSGGKRDGGSKSPMALIIGLLALLLGGGGGAAAMLGGGGGQSQAPSGYTQTATPAPKPSSSQGQGNGSAPVFGFGSSSAAASTTTIPANDGKLNTSVAPGSRDKRTVIKGNGQDVTTIMIYMCGTDLESRGGMGTSDLQEMLNARYDDHINIVVYTGGCKQWKNNAISSSTNQIWQLKDGKLVLLEKDLGAIPMTSPENLTGFIRYCTSKFPANRNDLIFWDHGGGSLTGYGYDEKFASNGSMNLKGIQKAIKDSKTTFDFIGFDACLMATLETAQSLTPYADYLIASEESEPGVGWYYTSWLNAYGKDPSMSTLEIGKNIIDGFTDECARKCRGQQTTLSIVDLAELENTVPDVLSGFFSETSKMIQEKNYQPIAEARSSTREFAASSRIDQIDLVDLAQKIGTDSSKALADALLSAVKYNRTSSNMTRAYGISAYFPCRKLSNVNSAVQLYQAIDMDDEYIRCIQEYASLGAAGQTVSAGGGATGNPLSVLLGGSGGSVVEPDMVATLLGSLFNGGSTNASGLAAGGLDFLSGRSMPMEDTIDYISENQFDAASLVWEEDSNGTTSISIPEDQWKLVTDLNLNMFYDDGEGFIDLGLDNVYEITEDGRLLAPDDNTWLGIAGQPVAYYHLSTVEDGDDYTITGYVPALLDGERVRLMLVFDQDTPYGYIAGAQTDYHDGETETQAKSLTELEEGSVLEFLCDYYSYNGEYLDTYLLGEPLTVSEDMEISNVPAGDGPILVSYRFTDLYGTEHWSQTLEQ